MASRIVGSAPILLVRDVGASATYYRDKVGFEINGTWGEPPGFCILERDGFHLMLALIRDGEPAVPHWRRVPQMWNVYFWVKDVDSLYLELEGRGALIDYGLCEKDYGCREFGIRDLDGHDVAFGEER